jgi:hypothetical protein
MGVHTQNMGKELKFNPPTFKTTKEAKELVEAGFEFICTTPENVMLFRKRK